MIAIDNSEWMRNGDMIPTRLQAQQEAVNFVSGAKLRANPENGVGLLSMSPNVEVLSTITRDDRKLFLQLTNVVVEGQCKLVNAIKIAHLALRHRQNRNHKMRIIVFVGSPVEEVENSEFIRLAKKLKKEKVNVDFICFGEINDNDDTEKLLQDFVDTLNSKDTQTSHILSVNSGVKLMEALVSSPICRDGDGNIIGGAMDFGNMEEDDPELALALRVSLEEQRQRQQREEQDANPEAANQMEVEQPQQQPQPSAAAPVQAQPSQPAEVNVAMLSEEEQLELALKMSMEQDQAASSEQMDVDPNVGDLMNDPAELERLVDQLSEEKKEDPNKDKTESK